jgi:hypothetical protein
MHAAEDRQVMIVGQMMQRFDGGLETLAGAEKSERADQLRRSRDVVDEGETRARGGAAHGAGFGLAEEGRRMIEDMAQTVHVLHVHGFG